MPTVFFDHARTDADLVGILSLQRANLPEALSEEELRAQGFVTVRHTVDLLRRMNAPWPHIVARDEGGIAGYALVMLPELEPEIPILQPMFEKIRTLEWEGRPIAGLRWFVMGQVCVARRVRGMGVFDGLYRHMRQRMASDFDCVITEISLRNPRSLRAHARVGFRTILEYTDPAGEDWAIVLWDWK